MNTRELTRREELCRSLNMDFDEAAELFSDETLESMQMAKVNGGVVPVGPVLTWIIRLLGGGAAVATVVSTCSDNSKPGPTLSSDAFEKAMAELKNNKADSIFVSVYANGSFDIRAYGLNKEPIPTPGGWHPPMVAPTN